MKTVFLCESEYNYKRVYDGETIKYLCESADCDGVCYKKQDIIDGSEKFQDTKFIFSTWSMPSFTEDEIKKYLPNLKCVFYSAGSVQGFARPFLNCDVKVFSAWAANAVPVAEYTVSQIILANKGYFKASHISCRKDYADLKSESMAFSGNYNTKVGIIGAGMIGKLVIKLLKNYNIDVLVFDPFLPDGKAEELGVRKTTLDAVFSQCSVITNHLANNQQTNGMLKKEHFEKMLPFATFINTGRGAQVVESDLIEVLKTRKDLTALLDVTMPEPPNDGSELYKLQNCILTPHIAGSSGNEVCRMAGFMLKEYKNFISGKECSYEVTLKMLETMA